MEWLFAASQPRSTSARASRGQLVTARSAWSRSCMGIGPAR